MLIKSVNMKLSFIQVQLMFSGFCSREESLIPFYLLSSKILWMISSFIMKLKITLSFKGDDLTDAVNGNTKKGKVVLASVKIK